MFSLLHQFAFSTFSLPSPSSSLMLPSDDDDDDDDDGDDDSDDDNQSDQSLNFIYRGIYSVALKC